MGAAALPLAAQGPLAVMLDAPRDSRRLAGPKHHLHRSLPGRRTGGSRGASGGRGPGEDPRPRRSSSITAPAALAVQWAMPLSRAPAPDGYTQLVTLSSLAVLPEADRLFERTPAYEVSQFTPVARILADPTTARGAGIRAVEDAEGFRRGRKGASRSKFRTDRPALRHAAHRDGNVCRGCRHQAAACALPRRGPAR